MAEKKETDRTSRRSSSVTARRASSSAVSRGERAFQPYKRELRGRQATTFRSQLVAWLEGAARRLWGKKGPGWSKICPVFRPEQSGKEKKTNVG